jgi:hypothetical protein
MYNCLQEDCWMTAFLLMTAWAKKNIFFFQMAAEL